jgi:hypothetical protein
MFKRSMSQQNVSKQSVSKQSVFKQSIFELKAIATHLGRFEAEYV